MAVGGIGLSCDGDCSRHIFFLFNSHSPLPSLYSPLFCHSFRITNEYALPSLNSSMLQLSVLSVPPLSSSPSPYSSSSSYSGASHGLRRSFRAETSLTCSLDERNDGHADEAARVERLWQHFFSDPSQWWDKRLQKENPEAPDFEHQTTENALRIKDRFSPSWLHAKLSTLDAQPPQHSPPSSKKSALSLQQKTCQASENAQLWEEFFLDPSQWRDYRCGKKSQRSPDFRHKNGRKALWIDEGLNPPWVHARLASLVGGQRQKESGSTPKISGKLAKTEQLWTEFFADPSQWWNNRFTKKTPKYPDFQRKVTREGLWSEDWLNPPWVKGKLATIALGWSGSSSLSHPWVPDSCNSDNVNKLCQQGRLEEVLEMVEVMLEHHTRAPVEAYLGLLKGFAKRKALVEGKRVHALIIQSELDSDDFLGNALVDMYANCGSLLDARKAFDTMPKNNVFIWTSIISAYTDHGQGTEAIMLFEQMKKSGIAPDKVAFGVALNACARIGDLERGRQLHSQISRCGLESDLVIGNILVDMYAKCGCIEQARQVFDKMEKRDVVSWNSMISGYVKSGSIDDAFEAFNRMNERDVVSWSTMITGCVQNGRGKKALALYRQMKHEGMKPNHVTYVGLLQACAGTGALEQGKRLHSDIIKMGCESDVIVGSALVDMYANCGSIELARQVFNRMSERDSVSWATMISGYARQGLGKEAFTLLEQMQREGMQPTEAAYVSILSACSHSGLVDEGRRLFHSICEDPGATPTVEHYACMVDLLGRAGHLAEAEDFINRMPIQADAVIWLTLLGAAKNHGNADIGRRAFDRVLKLEQNIDSAYVLLSNIYATAGMGDEVAKLRKEMKDVGVQRVLLN